MTDELTGAWMHRDNNEEHLLLFVDGYHTHSVYNKVEKKFIETHGGTYTTNGNKFTVTVEFDTSNKEQTGKSLVYNFWVTGDELRIDVKSKKMAYKKIDDGSAPLSGVWHITRNCAMAKLFLSTAQEHARPLRYFRAPAFNGQQLIREQKNFSALVAALTNLQMESTQSISIFFRRTVTVLALRSTSTGNWRAGSGTIAASVQKAKKFMKSGAGLITKYFSQLSSHKNGKWYI